MNFIDAVKNILLINVGPMTPQEIREKIKMMYPKFYGTTSHISNVEKRYYKNIDHALLAQIYSLVGTNNTFSCDKKFKPMRVSLVDTPNKLTKQTKFAHKSKDRIDHINRETKYDNKVKDILENAEKYHEAYYRAETFRGPSLYFHQRALETRQEVGSLTNLEYIYATLSAWGMHRMGKRGSKMQSFDTFRRSIEPLRAMLAEAKQFDFKGMDSQKWAVLEKIFHGIDIMDSGTSLVGNSKVMHHMLPNIAPPIDREYTLWFLRGNKNIKNDLASEWELMKEIISNFFIPVASKTEFALKALQWMEKKHEYPWDTSLLKIVDNLVIGSKK